MIYMIQMSMLFAGIATLFQTIGIGPVGRAAADRAGHQLRLPADDDPGGCGQGVAGAAGLMAGVLIGGVFHACSAS
jgi:xanthine/uracil permease